MRIKTERKEGDGNDNQKQHEHQRQTEPKPPPQAVCTHIGELLEPYSIQDGKPNSSDECLLKVESLTPSAPRRASGVNNFVMQGASRAPNDVPEIPSMTYPGGCVGSRPL